MHLLLAGAGHAHLVALRRLDPPPGTTVTLLSPEPAATYSGAVPALVAGLVPDAAARLPLAPLADRVGARLALGALASLDRAAGEAVLADGRRLRWDVLSLNLGSGIAAPPGLLPAKPWGPLLALAQAPPPGRIAVAGAGAAGVELALALAHRHGAGRVLLADAGGLPLPRAPAGMRARAVAALRRAGVEWRGGAAVTGWADGLLRLDDGATIPAATAIACTGAAPPAVLAGLGLPRDAAGWLATDRCLRVRGEARVLAAGDCAATGAPRAGVYAVRAGPALARNLRAVLRGEAPSPWRPQRRTLQLIGTGDGHAFGSWAAAAPGARGTGATGEGAAGPPDHRPAGAAAAIPGLSFGGDGPLGALAWRWKRRLDARWVAAHAG